MKNGWKRVSLVSALMGIICAGGWTCRVVAQQGQAQNPGIPASANIPKNLKKYFVAFLVKSEKWKEGESEAVIGPLVEGHLAHIRAQSEKGEFALVGPFLDNGKILGMAIANATSAEEVAQILEGDPFMKTGLVKTEIHPVYLEDLSGVKFEYAK